MFEADYIDGKWQNACIRPLAKIELHPTTSALHYGQAIFEGMKAKNQEGKAQIFRPEMNWKRLNEVVFGWPFRKCLKNFYGRAVQSGAYRTGLDPEYRRWFSLYPPFHLCNG